MTAHALINICEALITAYINKELTSVMNKKLNTCNWTKMSMLYKT